MPGTDTTGRLRKKAVVTISSTSMTRLPTAAIKEPEPSPPLKNIPDRNNSTRTEKLNRFVNAHRYFIAHIVIWRIFHTQLPTFTIIRKIVFFTRDYQLFHNPQLIANPEILLT
ncbi:hypothetical protein [Rathayibacter toxicus]|uniref:hypothetical protein n=1 Tax=Rathayibacter toxicus TaxID=145458 RepID=UPI0011B07A2B|nr:hypothetical protein [Rathayibacter toxicus]QOD10606.1 hypothetical protein BSG36_00965 [Rathayibacter toxicus]QWL27343.1 hypothetical protein E2R33_00970 [Rathayibacter toxicus]